jgi:hypothetical protein
MHTLQLDDRELMLAMDALRSHVFTCKKQAETQPAGFQRYADDWLNEGQRAEALRLKLLMADTPPARYVVEQFDGASYQVTDTEAKVEICTTTEFEHASMLETTDAKARAESIAKALNATRYEYKPKYS